MSLLHFHFALSHAWLNLLDKHMTTGRINQVASRLRAFFALESAAIAAESPSPRPSALHPSRRVRGGRFCTRVAESVTVGHVVSKPLGSPVGLDDVRDPIHRVKTGWVCEGMPRSKPLGCAADRPIEDLWLRPRWRDLPIEDLSPRAVGKRPADRGSFSLGRGEETCRSRIFLLGPWGRDLPIEDLFPRAVGKRPADRGSFSSGRGKETCRSRIFFLGPWERDLPVEDLSHRANRSRNFRSGLGPCQHCNDGRFRRFRPRQASRIAQIRSNTLKTVFWANKSFRPRPLTADLEQSHMGELTFRTEGQRLRLKFHQFPYWLSYELAASSLPYIYLIRRSVLPTCWTFRLWSALASPPLELARPFLACGRRLEGRFERTLSRGNRSVGGGDTRVTFWAL